ncbi:MAG: hypothetical protein ABIK20_05380 [Candidatus Omnitrophota bacterium]
MYSNDMGWLGDDNFNYSKIDSLILRTLDGNPDAYIMLKPLLYDYYGVENNPDLKWGREHKDQMCKMADGILYEALYKNSARYVPSLASEKWLKTAEKKLRNLIRHIEESPFGGRIISYQPCMLEGPEWMYWGGAAPDIFCDYSVSMQEAFRKYIAEKYASGPQTFLDDVAIPTPEERTKKSLGLFFDPKEDRKVIDYNRFFSEIVADTVEHFARIIKEETNGRVLTGAYYGYTFALADGRRLKTGHYALSKLLNSPYIDWLFGIASYHFRGLGGNAGLHTPCDSVTLHNKLYMVENDLRPFPTFEGGSSEGTKTIADTIAVIKREGYADIIRGIEPEWYDFGRRWYAPDKRIMHVLKRMNQISQLCLNIEKERTGVAVIIDEKTADYITTNSLMMANFLWYQQYYFGHSGVPVSYYLLDDITNPELLKYKCIIFLFDFKMDNKQKQYIKQALQKDNRTLVWVYAAGFIEENKFSIENMRDLIGMNVEYKEIPDSKSLNVEIVDSKHPITESLSDDFKFGQEIGDDKLRIMFYVDDSNVRTLGKFTNSGEGGFCVKKFPNWNSVYIGAPRILPPIVKGIARFAGINVYNENEDDNTMANNKLLMVHTLGGGEREIKLPSKMNVYNLYEDKLIAQDVKAFKVILNPRSTYMFYTGSEKEYRQLKEACGDISIRE